jgi:hypothetical protein
MSSKSSKPFKAGRRTEILCIPFLVGERNGPSQCAPKDSEPSDARRLDPDGPRKGSACVGLIHDHNENVETLT